MKCSHSGGDYSCCCCCCCASGCGRAKGLFQCFPCSRASPEAEELQRRNRHIDKQLRKEQRKMQHQIKILLLGAGESGKSTFLKQMKIIHGVVFEPDQIKEYRHIIYQNVIRGMRVLVDAHRKLHIPLERASVNQLAGDQLLLFDNFSQVTVNNFCDFQPVLQSLWADSGIRSAYERRSEFQLSDSVAYFFDNLERIASTKYVPSQQDILYCRRTTKGIEEFCLQIGNVPFLFVDVGGQRTQRQKWLQCFNNVTAILFLASSSEFDQVLLEDRRVNRLLESINIFDTIVNNRIFVDVDFILFLNKMDLLEDKVLRKRVDISKHFPQFISSADDIRKAMPKFSADPLRLIDVKWFILYLFSVKLKMLHSRKKPLYHHFTTAVDTRNIQFVFASVKETILRKNLEGLMLQ